MKLGLGGHGRWLTALVVGFIVGGAVTFFALPRRAPAVVVDQPLCDRTFTIAAGIHDYLTERRASDPTGAAHPLIGVEEQDQDDTWAAYIETTATYNAQTMAGFTATFAGESQFLVDTMAAAGFWDGPTEVVSVNELAVQRLATELDAAAMRAGCDR